MYEKDEILNKANSIKNRLFSNTINAKSKNKNKNTDGINNEEQEEIKLDSKDKLIPGIKEIPVLFEEADGLWINLQGND